MESCGLNLLEIKLSELSQNFFKVSSRSTRNTIAKKEDGEKETKVTKENNSAKGYEPDRIILENSMHTAIQELNMPNEIDTAVRANTMKIQTELKSIFYSDFLKLINSLNSFKVSITQN